MMQNKFFTLSYDDGITQDKRLVKIFNKYGIRATFNINSELLGNPGYLRREDMWISHNKIEPREVAELYRGHEVAAHTLTHPFLPELDDEEIIRQIEEDRKNLEKLLGKDIVGLAYPGGGIGGVNTNEHIISLIRKNSKIKYARTTICNGSFDTQDNLLEFHPTAYHLNFDEIMELGEKFIKLKTEEKKIFYIWGHSYEFDVDDNWEYMESILKKLAFHDDIFYGTNSQVLLQLFK